MSLILEPDHKRKSKRGGAPTSLAAWDQVQPNLTEREQAVLAVIAAHPGGRTMKEVAEEMRVPLNCVSGRAIALKSKGLVEGTGIRRDGSEVLRKIVRGQQSLFGSAA